MHRSLAFVILGAAAIAQHPLPVAPVTSAPFHGVFVADPAADGSLWVRGERYKLGLTVDGAVYQPLFGPAASRDFPLQVRLVRLRVGERDLPVTPRGGWQQPQERVFTRDCGPVRECWRALPEGAQVAFAIPEPAGPGALSLRLAAAGDLRPVGDGPGVRFPAPALGEVRCSAATVFDAAGAQLALPVTVVDGELAIEVPAAFTAVARWPLLVDPLLTTVAVDATVSERRNPRVACEPTTGNWLVVAEEHLSATDVDLVCSRYSSADPPVLLDTVYADNTPELTHNPDVGFVAATQRFILGWHNATNGVFQFRNRQANSTTQSTTIGIGGGIGNDLENAVRIGSSIGPDRFLLVLFRHQGGLATPLTSMAASLHSSSGALFSVVTVPVGTFASMQNIASPGDVSTLASASDKWLIAWPEQTATFLPNYLARMQAIGFTTSTGPLTLEPSVILTPVNSAVVSGAAIAGRGGNLFAVWSRVSAATGSDLHGVPIGVVGGVFAPLTTEQNLSAQEPNGLVARAQRAPVVSFDGTRFVYGYLEDDGAGTTLPFAATVLVTGTAVAWHEGHLQLGTDHTSTLDLGYGANSVPGVHWAVVQQLGPTGTGDVQAAVLDARVPGSTATFAPTGCGSPSAPAIALAGTPALGRTFTVSLTNAPVFPILLVGPGSLTPLPGCAGCTLGVAMAGLQMFLGSSLSVTVPADPALLQFQLAFQGMSGLHPGGCPASFLGFDFALSDTLTITVR